MAAVNTKETLKELSIEISLVRMEQAVYVSIMDCGLNI